MLDKKISFEELIDFVFIAFFSLYCLLPSFQNSTGFITVVGAIILYVAFVIFTDKPDASGKIFIFVLLTLFVSLCYYFLTETATIDSATENYNLKRFLSKFNQLSMSFMPLLMLYRVNKLFSPKYKKIFLFLCLVIFGYVIINSYNEYQINESAARSWAEFDKQAENNVATYGYVYAVSAFVPMVFVFTYNVKNKWLKASGIVALAGLLAFLMSAQYTIALLIPVICCVIYAFQTSKSTAGKAMAILLIPLVIWVLPYVFDFLAKYINSSDVKMRFNELAMFFRGRGDETYDLNDRMERYKICIQYFLSNPLIGKEPPVDGHSTILSVLCDIGLLGSVPFFYMYALAKNITYKLTGYEKRTFFVTFLSLIILGFLNPILSTYTLAFVVWFLVPLCMIVLKESKVEGLEKIIEKSGEDINEKLGN